MRPIIVLVVAIALGPLATLAHAQETLASSSYSSRCTVALPWVGETGSASYDTLVESGSVSSSALISASYGTILDVFCDPAAGSVGGCATTLCGDCNGDGVVSILDSLTAAQHAVMTLVLTGSQFDNCNVDGDGDVDVLDSLLIAQLAAGLMVSLMCC